MSQREPEFAAFYEQPAELLSRLIQFDTTNPPGNEGECVRFVERLAKAWGAETRMIAKAPDRPNLIARFPGRGDAAPLLLYGHADVVTTADQAWRHPPFGGVIGDGYVWGRGALDMKGGIAMMLAALGRAQAQGVSLPGDVILAVVCDEENAGNYGSKFLAEEHPGLFEGVRYALGELGGFPIYFRGLKLYGIQVAEKQVCRLDAIVRGPAGHASMPIRGGAMAKLGRLLQALDERRLPVHVTPVVRRFFARIADAMPGEDTLADRLLDPTRIDQELDRLGQEGLMFNAMLHHTVSPTMVRGGQQENVIPSEARVRLDGRILPGYDQADFLQELAGILPSDVELDVRRFSPGPPEADMGLFDLLATVIEEADPEAIAVPLLLTATTDARFYARLGIQTYGFMPMNLPPEMNVLRMAHAADERIPVEAVAFGTQAMLQVLQRFT
jgi:acetylornithine deacetylase/succinyl-diaminopimelate desuccinylase-like protein